MVLHSVSFGKIPNTPKWTLFRLVFERHFCTLLGSMQQQVVLIILFGKKLNHFFILEHHMVLHSVSFGKIPNIPKWTLFRLVFECHFCTLLGSVQQQVVLIILFGKKLNHFFILEHHMVLHSVSFGKIPNITFKSFFNVVPHQFWTQHLPKEDDNTYQ